MMDELQGIYAVWLREVVVFFRERERLVSSLISPLLWIFAFGSGLGASVVIEGMNYQHFIFPGIMVMTMLFTSLFYGVYVVWDRKLDFLKEVLVSPLSRRGVFLGKLLGGITDAMIQATVILVIGMFLGIPFTPQSIVMAYAIMFLVSTCMTALGLFFGALLTSMESFQLIANFVVWPLFMFSGALFPVKNLPDWLAAATAFDPLTYGVEALRTLLLGTHGIPMEVCIAALVISCVVTMAMGSWAFGRMEQI